MTEREAFEAALDAYWIVSGCDEEIALRKPIVEMYAAAIARAEQAERGRDAHHSQVRGFMLAYTSGDKDRCSCECTCNTKEWKQGEPEIHEPDCLAAPTAGTHTIEAETEGWIQRLQDARAERDKAISERDAALELSLQVGPAEFAQMRNDCSALRAEVAALKAGHRNIVADLAPLHKAMQHSKYTTEAWAHNVCEFAAKELVELRAERDEWKQRAEEQPQVPMEYQQFMVQVQAERDAARTESTACLAEHNAVGELLPEIAERANRRRWHELYDAHLACVESLGTAHAPEPEGKP